MMLLGLHNVIFRFLISGATNRYTVAVQVENLTHAAEAVNAIVADQSDSATQMVINFLMTHQNLDRTVSYMIGYWMKCYDADPTGDKAMDDNSVPVFVQEYVERIVDMICSMP